MDERSVSRREDTRQVHEREIHISRAADEGDLREAYRLRYKVLVEREGWKLGPADPETATVSDEYDQHAIIFIARSESNQIRGTVRYVLWRDLSTSLWSEKDNAPKYIADMGITLPESLPQEVCSTTSHLVVEKRREFVGYLVNAAQPATESRKQKHTSGTALCLAMYQLGHQFGIEVDWITCGEPDSRFYEKFGYSRFAAGLIHPDRSDDPSHHGCILMYLILNDLEHLRKVKSPFVRYCRVSRNDFGRQKELRRILEEKKRSELA